MPIDLLSGSNGSAVNTVGLTSDDIWYLAELTASTSFEWRTWGRNPGIPLGNYPGEGNPPNCDPPPPSGYDKSAGLLRGPYEIGELDSDYIIDVDVPVLVDKPKWQYTWVILENSTDKDLLVEYLEPKLVPNAAALDTEWDVNYNQFIQQDLVSIKVLGVWTGIGTAAGCVRCAADGLLSKTGFPHGINGLSYVNISACSTNWNAHGQLTYTDNYGNVLDATHYPWRNLRATRSDEEMKNDSTKWVLLETGATDADKQALVAIMAVSADQESSDTGSTAAAMDMASVDNGWKIWDVGMQIRYFE